MPDESLWYLFLYLVFVLKQNTRIILSAWSLAYRYGFQLVVRGDKSVPFPFYKPDFWELYTAILNGYIAVDTVRCVTLMVGFLRLEFRKSSLRVSEKVIICGLQVHLRICKRKTVNFARVI